MKRTVHLLLATAVAGVAGGILTAAVSPAVADVSGNQFTVTENLVAVHRTDVGKKGPSVGDTIVFYEQLRQRGETVGREDGSCVNTRHTKTTLFQVCTESLRFPGHGSIEFQGLTWFGHGTPPLRGDFAVLGGTGQYVGATGTVEIVNYNNSKPDKLLVKLQ